MHSTFARRLVATVVGLSATLGSLRAQTPVQRDTTRATPLEAVTVTATRTPTAALRVPNPVNVIDSMRLRTALPNGVTDLLREEPGLDLTGVGPNQGRPIIRGHRGQRILLLEDGIRLNNSRRQQDFGELPALAGLTGIERVEVVRGPLSVLYGSDAIGGVINLITAGPTYGGLGSRIQGSLGYRYSTTDDQQRPAGKVFGQVGRFGFGITGSYRDAEPYSAPSGTFGNLTLPNETKVLDTGMRDGALSVEAGYGWPAGHTVFARYSRYDANDVGFGYVDNAALGTPDAATVQIRYPDQSYHKVSLGYRASALALPFADRVEVTGYRSANTRTFTLDIFAPFGPGTPAGAGVQINARNFTDIGTTGFRAEAAKVLGGHVLTYGFDFFRDRSDNTDSSTTTVTGFGPPRTTVNDSTLTPNASFRSIGIFVQGELAITERLLAVLGARWQDIRALTRPTPRTSASPARANDQALVGALNLSYRVVPGVRLVATAGRAFRSPNLIERFFTGPVAEASAYQVQNPDLDPETSVEVDVGIKLHRGRISGEAFVFRNEVRNAIRAVATGDSVGPLAEFQNINVDRIRTTGVELSASIDLWAGLFATGSYTDLSSKDPLDASNPVGDSYSSKLTGRLGWRESRGRIWAEYLVRHNGTRKDVALGDSPVGPALPAFTVHALRGGARLFRLGSTTHELTVAVNNLTNRLYSEFGNTSFFRPEPKRSLALGWTSSF